MKFGKFFETLLGDHTSIFIVYNSVDDPIIYIYIQGGSKIVTA